MASPNPKVSGSGTAPRRSSATPAERRLTRILVAGSQELDRIALSTLLKTQPDFKIVGQADTASHVVDLCQRRKHDLVILDVRVMDLRGESSLNTLRHRFPKARVLAVLPHGQEECLILNPTECDVGHGHPCCGISDCMAMALFEGALGVIHRDASAEELFQAVRSVADGVPWLDRSGRWEHVLERLSDRRLDPVELLTQRETEVAILVGKGKSNKEISFVLGVGEPTVKKHIGHILAKLNLQDRLQLGICVVRHPMFFGSPNLHVEDTPDRSGLPK